MEKRGVYIGLVEKRCVNPRSEVVWDSRILNLLTWHFLQRLMQNENSLLHEVYKARYFPHNDYFEIKLGSNLSYAWLGIWEAKKVLLQGRRWRIGDGKKAKIFLNLWIPNMGLLPFQQVELSEDLRVRWLINKNSNSWDIP